MFNVEISNDFDDGDVWNANLAASEHMCLNRELFESICKVNNESYRVKIGDGSLLTVVGIGGVKASYTTFQAGNYTSLLAHT